KATLRAPLAYLGRRPLASSLVTSAFAIVVALVSSFAAYAGTYYPDYARDSGGWDLRVWSPEDTGVADQPFPTGAGGRALIQSHYYRGPVRVVSADGQVPSDFHQQSLQLFGLGPAE